MKKKIIQIDQDKCVGCGLCANACQEGAIGLVDGKAQLLREDYCDGLGNCLPVCPTDAISFIEKDVDVKNDNEKIKLSNGSKDNGSENLPCGCPGTNMKSLKTNEREDQRSTQKSVDTFENDNVENNGSQSAGKMPSELMQWPVQINLVPVNAPYFDNADLLIAADCTAYAYNGFHNEIMKGRVTLIGCPKLDPTDYSEKLTEIIKNNNIRSVTVARMEVPCCGGIQSAVEKAMEDSGKLIPSQVITISTDGKILK